MKTLVIKEKFSFRDRFSVTDEQGNVRYQVEGKILTVGKKATIFDMNEREVARVEEKLGVSPKFELTINDELVATIKQKISLVDKYEIACHDIEVKGNLLGLKFSILQKGEKIGEIRQKALAATAKYEVDIYDDSCELLALSMVLAIAFANEVLVGAAGGALVGAGII